MKQGIVMEIKNKKAIVLTKEGAFESVSLKKGQHVEIGSEIEVPVSRSYFKSSKKRISTLVAAAVVLVLFFTQYPFLQNSNLAVAAYVGLDINPSIEVGVNNNLKVVEVIPINDDGKIIVEQIDDDYRNKPLSEFIDDTIELAKADGYLMENNDVLLTITTIDKDAQTEIEEKVNVIKEETEQKGVTVTTLSGDENTRKEAKDLGVSTGKYMIYKKSKETLTIEETKELSVTQIYEKLDKGKKQKDNEEKNSKIEKNNSQKIEKETKKEQKADNKQQKFEDKENNKNKNNENNPSHEPSAKIKVKENNGDHGKAEKNKAEDSPPSNGKWNHRIKESDEDKSSKNKKNNFEKHEEQQRSHKDKKEDKDSKEKNKDMRQSENNRNKKEN